jgi:invasion protein IalB
MSFRRLPIPGLPRAAALVAAIFAVSTIAHAQQPAAPAAGTPLEAQEQTQQSAQPLQRQGELIYTPWIKYCLKAPDSKQTCFIGKDGRAESGNVLVASVVIEPEGEPNKILRVTLPLGVMLVHGTRLIVDNNTPAQSPYVICFANGCISDYQLTPDLLANMKKGQNLVIQAINSSGSQVTLPLPLQETNGGFAKAYDGQPPDPRVIEDNYKKMQEELQRRANEAHPKPAEAQPPAAATPAPAAK